MIPTTLRALLATLPPDMLLTDGLSVAAASARSADAPETDAGYAIGATSEGRVLVEPVDEDGVPRAAAVLVETVPPDLDDRSAGELVATLAGEQGVAVQAWARLASQHTTAADGYGQTAAELADADAAWEALPWAARRVVGAMIERVVRDVAAARGAGHPGRDARAVLGADYALWPYLSAEDVAAAVGDPPGAWSGCEGRRPIEPGDPLR